MSKYNFPFNGKHIIEFEVDGIETWDYPDFCDAFISYALYDDMTELTDAELETLNDENRGLVHELAWNQAF